VNNLVMVSYVALWVLVAVMAVAVLALYNHFGRMYLSSREVRGTQGPAVGSRLAAFRAAALDESDVAVPSGRPLLLLLASTDCPECGRLLDPVQRLAEQRAGEVDVVVVCGGRRTEVTEWARGLRSPVRVIIDYNFRRAAAMGVGITPFVVAVDAAGVVVARGLVNGEDGIRFAVDDLLREARPELRPVEMATAGGGLR